MLLLDGSISILNQNNELIVTCFDGFIRLNDIFGDIYSHYKLFCNTSGSILVADADALEQIIVRYPNLRKAFYRQANEIELLLVHLKSTRDNLASRICLLPLLSGLRQICLEPGLANISDFAQGSFVILFAGCLIHDSGKELIIGQVYECSSLPTEGDWYSLGGSNLFAYVNKKCDADDSIHEPNSSAIDTVGAATIDEDKIFVSWESLSSQAIFNRLRISISKVFNPYPLCKQSNNSSGVACLVSVARFLGKKLDFKYLQTIEADDVSALALINIARAAEIPICYGKTNLCELKHIEIPVIIGWKNRYAVLYEVDDFQAVIGDPQAGVERISLMCFCSHWDGYAFWFSSIKESKISKPILFSFVLKFRGLGEIKLSL